MLVVVFVPVTFVVDYISVQWASASQWLRGSRGKRWKKREEGQVWNKRESRRRNTWLGGDAICVATGVKASISCRGASDSYATRISRCVWSKRYGPEWLVDSWEISERRARANRIINRSFAGTSEFVRELEKCIGWSMISENYPPSQTMPSHSVSSNSMYLCKKKLLESAKSFTTNDLECKRRQAGSLRFHVTPRSTILRHWYLPRAFGGMCYRISNIGFANSWIRDLRSY